MYFQWMMAIGAWLVGVIVNYCANQPPLFSLSTLSGIMWATGNTLSIPSFYFVGIGIGQTVQGNLNLLGGWISGSFILCQHIGSVIANYIGVVIVVISTILLAFVKVDTTKQHKSFLCCKFSFFKSRNEEENSLLLDKSTSVNHASIQMSDDKIPPQHADDDANIIVRLKTKPVGKLIGLGLSIASGSLLGFQYLPIELLKKCDDDDVFSCHGLPYSFGMFVGILLASTFWFILYCIIMKFNPRINPKLTVPAIISGILFGIGNVSWILSNEFVGLPISFPIITAGASIVSCTWGVLVFREITGWKNLALFLLSFTFIVIGIIIVGISFNNF
jgi:glucose uptake protein GlcU